MLPVAILCGGRGTRSGATINKCFQDVNGKPFLLHLLESLERQGRSTVVLCRGQEGTLAAIRRAAPQLGERFLVLYGDTLLPLDLDDFERQWARSGRLHATAMIGNTDAGVNGVTRWTLELAGRAEASFAAYRDLMAQRGQRYRYEAPAPWIEVGTPEALEHARLTLAA